MQTATSEFKECMNNGYPEYGTARITLTDGTIIDVEKDDFLMDSNGFSINRSCSSTNRFEIGTVVSSCLTMKLLNFDGRYNLYDFNKAKVTKVSIGMELPSGKTEIIPQGNFIVDAQDFNGGIVTLTCYDNLAEWDVNYTGNKNGTAINLIVAMATKHKVVLSNNNFNNCNYEVNIADDVKCTDRQMLSYILSITGNNANIDRNGYLEVLGGKDSNAYKDGGIRGSVYSDIYKQLKREFGCVATYKSIKRKYLADVHEFIDTYLLPIALAEVVHDTNM